MKHFYAVAFLGFLAMVVATRASASVTGGEACELLPSLQSEVAQRYQHYRLITLADLNKDDRAKFVKDHAHRCPGVSKLNFFGAGESSTALSLLSHDRTKALLVIAQQSGDRWTLTKVDDAKVAVPVVWSQMPDTYVDVETGKKLSAKYPVIVWCEYDAWAIVYAQTVSGISKVWVAD